MFRESRFQKELINDIYDMFPGCYILKNDPSYLQGIPDLIILYEKKWAMLECKRSENFRTQPNQKYYIDNLNLMSYASFVYPENREEVLDELQQALKPDRPTRLPKR